MLCRTVLLLVSLTLPICSSGCAGSSRDLDLDADLARASLKKALESWVDGKSPNDLKPQIVIGDPSWNAGRQLVSFEIKSADEKSDGTNLYLPVVCHFKDKAGKTTSAETNYIVGTSPVVTIFPQ